MSVLVCAKCQTKNYLDPYPFWNFKGKVKCAGCDEVYYIEKRNYKTVKGPERAKAPHDRLPAYAETPDFKPVTDPSKVAPPPRARAVMALKPVPVTKSIRGRPVSGRPLKGDDLTGSRPKFIIEGRVYSEREPAKV